MDTVDENGFAYEVMMNRPNGTGPIFPVTASWFKQNFKKEMVDFLNRSEEETTAVWTMPKVGTLLNTYTTQEFLKEYQELQEPKTREIGKEYFAITWLHLKTKWRKIVFNDKVKFEEVEKQWYLSSVRISKLKNTRPVFRPELGNNPPNTVKWFETNEEFLRNGFGDDNYINSIIHENNNRWIEENQQQAELLDQFSFTLDTYRQVNCDDYYVDYNIKCQQICGIVWNPKRKIYRGMYKLAYENIEDVEKGRFQVTDLPDEWIQENYGSMPNFLKHVQERSKYKRPFVFIPPGKSKKGNMLKMRICFQRFNINRESRIHVCVMFWNVHYITYLLQKFQDRFMNLV